MTGYSKSLSQCKPALVADPVGSPEFGTAFCWNNLANISLEPIPLETSGYAPVHDCITPIRSYLHHKILSFLRIISTDLHHSTRLCCNFTDNIMVPILKL